MVVCALCDGRVRIVMSPQELDTCRPVKNTRFSVFCFLLGVHKSPVHPFHSGCLSLAYQAEVHSFTCMRMLALHRHKK